MKNSTFLLLLHMLIINSNLSCSNNNSEKLIDHVNPFIGTSDGGNTFPGAVRPWGMVSVSPHTAPSAPSGYYNGEKFFYGLGMVHLSGTGCADQGSIIITATRGALAASFDAYRCTYSDEQAAPGFYSVRLTEPDVTIMATATDRCGMLRIVPQRDGEIVLLIDVGRNLSRVGGGSVEIVSEKTIQGYNIAGGFCGELNRHKVYFAAELSDPAAEQGLWKDDVYSNAKHADTLDGSIGIWSRMNAKQEHPLIVKVGISYVSVENAWENLRIEIPDWNFERIRLEAETTWEKELSRIRVSGGSHDDYKQFYTALYHALIHPSILNDCNGEYPLMGHYGIGRYKERDRYSIFSLWDTYRTLHPLLTLVYPQRQSEIIKSMIDMYDECGFLPKWELCSNETYMMVGDPAPIVIADSYIKGIRDFDVTKAYQAVKKPTIIVPGESAPPIRAGYHELLEYSYIPFDQDTSKEWWVWGPVSTTQEYCLVDWTIARLAGALGYVDDEKEYDRRSLLYKNLFDRKTQFMRPKLSSGEWLDPFDPLETEGSGNWAGSGGPGYVEGNAWNYTWFVPHDVQGLVSLFGGESAFVKKLARCFELGHFTINNEPDIAYPYLFTYFPEHAFRTQGLVRQIMDTEFNSGASGLPGNDDAGTISAWYIFSALGFYPACPASPEYRLASPLFERAVIQLDERYYSGREFIIESRGCRSHDSKLRQILLNGVSINNYQLLHEQVVAGGTLVFEFQD